MRFEDSTPNPGLVEKLLKLVMLNKVVVLHQILELSFEILKVLLMGVLCLYYLGILSLCTEL